MFDFDNNYIASLSPQIAEFVSEQIAKSVIKSRFYLFQNATASADAYGQNFLWGYDLDKEFHLFLELCPTASSLGNHLLKYCDVLRIYRKFDVNKNTEPELYGPEADLADMRKIFNNLRQIMESQVLSHKKQNMITVELLIKAHDCFVHECSMEGIANILHRCKSTVNTLTMAKSWHLIVRLVMGVGRYRDMYYCFEKLIENEQFESLLGQFDEERAIGLKEAIIKYLRENHPEDKEKYRLAALHFQMYKELAEQTEAEACATLKTIMGMYEIKLNHAMTASSSSAYSSMSVGRSDSSEITNTATANGATTISIAKAGCTLLKCRKYIVDQLFGAMDNFTHCAEYHLLENKLDLAQKCASQAELIALQIHLIRVAMDASLETCFCILSVRSESVFRHLVAFELGVPQALILSRAYPFEINWAEAIFNQYIGHGKQAYIEEYCARMDLSEDMIEVIVKSYMQQTAVLVVTPQMEQRVSHIVEMVESVTLRYKLASLLSDKRIIATLINDRSLYYLKDTNYGRCEGAA